MDYSKESVIFHKKLKGKVEVVPRVKIENQDDLSLAYTPGVASVCLEIQKNKELAYDYTRKWNTVAVITDGSAVLGLGNIGPEASMPVMEGKCLLFKTFGDVDAMPICIDTNDVDSFVNIVYNISKSFGGINLEDIAAPRCFEIENLLKEKCDIPIFHDDQHGTAIVILAGLINSLKLVNKKAEDVKIVISGAGAAGIAICKLLIAYGCKNIIMCDSKGIIYKGRKENKKDFANKITNTENDYILYNDRKIPFILEEIANKTNKDNLVGSLKDALVGADVFIGVSAPNIVDYDMIKSMNENAIVFACANPIAEVDPNEAKRAGAAIVATGRSDLPNQLNNLLVFPGIFRGLFDAKIKYVTEKIKIEAAKALALYVGDRLSCDYIIPSPLDKNVANVIADTVIKINNI